MCVQYWPASKEKDEEYGGIGVSVLKEEELANFHIRTIKLYKKNENDVSHKFFTSFIRYLRVVEIYFQVDKSLHIAIDLSLQLYSLIFLLNIK